MESPIRNLETNVHKIVLGESLWALDSWKIGNDMSALFGGPPTTRRYVRKEQEEGRWLPKFMPHIERYYHSPTLPVGAVADGDQTKVEVDPDRPDLITVVQAYYDWMRHDEQAEIELRFEVAPDDLNGLICGDDWRFSARLTDEAVATGVLRATAATHPERLATAGRGLSSIINKLLPSGGEELLQKRYAPSGLEHLARIWEYALQERTALSAARIVMGQCTRGV